MPFSARGPENQSQGLEGALWPWLLSGPPPQHVPPPLETWQHTFPSTSREAHLPLVLCAWRPLGSWATQHALEWGPTSHVILAMLPVPGKGMSEFMALGRNSLNAVVLIRKTEMLGAVTTVC